MIRNPIISVIIPCYNADKFITETISSAMNQSYTNIEIIVIDDGSSDDSKAKVENLTSNKVHYVHQQNQGVSVARNNGLKIARGEYVLFLDADDIISTDFIMNRFKFLETNLRYGACSSIIKIINEKGEKQKCNYENACKIEDLTSFNQKKYTCPSGYLFRNSTLKSNELYFNSLLSSSADKLFLYNFFKYSTIGFIDNSPLFYRVYDKSMSNNLTEKLVEDHISFLNLIIKHKVIPEKEKKSVIARVNYTIGASYYHLKKRKKTIHYLFNSIISSPRVFLRLITKK